MAYVSNYAICQNCGWRMWIKAGLYIRCTLCKKRIEVPPKEERV